MHLASTDSLRPTNILREADKLMEHARALYENYEQIMKPVDRTVAKDKMTWANDFKHGLEEKSWMDQAEQAKLYFNQAQEALETVKVVSRSHFSGEMLTINYLLSDQRCVDQAIEMRCQNDGTPLTQGSLAHGTVSVVGNWGHLLVYCCIHARVAASGLVESSTYSTASDGLISCRARAHSLDPGPILPSSPPPFPHKPRRCPPTPSRRISPSWPSSSPSPPLTTLSLASGLTVSPNQSRVTVHNFTIIFRPACTVSLASTSTLVPPSAACSLTPPSRAGSPSWLASGEVIYVDPMLHDPKFSTNGLLRLGATICSVQPDPAVKGGSRSFRKAPPVCGDSRDKELDGPPMAGTTTIAAAVEKESTLPMQPWAMSTPNHGGSAGCGWPGLEVKWGSAQASATDASHTSVEMRALSRQWAAEPHQRVG
ncbi:hypothetical protein EDB85DRAFT_1899338 [Lactarius pseudohatsudake]|nr:hypothetical protein EDB85DRAFT_1899338 [Lactarius pseudohatsudake]